MTHSANNPHPSHPPIGAAMAAAFAANGMVPPPLPSHSAAGFTPGGLPSSSAAASAAANAHLLALTQSAGLLQQQPPLAQQMLGVRGMNSGNPVSGHFLGLNHKDDVRRAGERSSSGRKFMLSLIFK